MSAHKLQTAIPHDWFPLERHNAVGDLVLWERQTRDPVPRWLVFDKLGECRAQFNERRTALRWMQQRANGSSGHQRKARHHEELIETASATVTGRRGFGESETGPAASGNER